MIPEQKGIFDKEGQRWDDEVYTIKSIALSKATLTNPEGNTMRKKFRLSDLQRSPTNTEKPTKVKAVKEAKKQAKVKRIIRKEGVDEANIVETPINSDALRRSGRDRKQTERLKF